MLQYYSALSQYSGADSVKLMYRALQVMVCGEKDKAKALQLRLSPDGEWVIPFTPTCGGNHTVSVGACTLSISS